MDGHVYGYQLDPAFIHIDDQKEILDFIAKSSTNDEVSNWLMKVVEGLDHKLTTIETKISGRAVNPKHEISDRTKIFFSIFKDPGMVT
ncbi:MAG: hypothetical protein KDC05_13510, partial [Bacteroidales bacterium]|nr:hypothetical protein [Bacteroidales bacterium]